MNRLIIAVVALVTIQLAIMIRPVILPIIIKLVRFSNKGEIARENKLMFLIINQEDYHFLALLANNLLIMVEAAFVRKLMN